MSYLLDENRLCARQHGGQSLALQIEQLTAAGCGKIFQETASGAKSERTELRKMLASLAPEQIVTVTRLDRLARSTADLLSIVKTISDKGATFKSLAEPWADTTTSAGRLVLTILGGLAEFERDLIRVRTGEGRDRAKRAGIKMGRKPKLSGHQVTEVQARKNAGESVRHLARSYGVSPNTISRVR